MAKSVYSVSGMKCEHCKANVENALRGIVGVRLAEVDLAAGNVSIDFDEAVVAPEQLKETVDNSGRYELSL